MHFTLLLPGALVPSGWAVELAGAVQAPCLQARLARAALISEMRAPDSLSGGAHLAWLNPRLFAAPGDVGAVGADASTAPYALAALSGQAPAADAQVFHADAVHFGFARDHLVVEALDDASEDELAALLQAARAACAEHGAQLLRAGGRGFLSVAPRWELTTTPGALIFGRSASAVLPKGPDAKRWSRLHNEIQMIWHTHPVNAEREAKGQRAINGLCLSGGGHWRRLPAPGFTALHADAPELQGAAAAAAIAAADAGAAPVDGCLLVRADAFDACVRQDWHTWLGAIARLDAWLAGRRQDARHAQDSIDFVLAGRELVRTLRSRPYDALRFWRNAPLAKTLAE